ncbi:hypothetical protein ABW19_dt0208904 [Dactylella cylindrospora]|nr:hypothetical protein ABW19_dt0208904 [Dactylella cylindrospora]
MSHYSTMPVSNLPEDRALVVFKINAPSDIATVHLVGSWDNFSAPLLLARDSKSAWKICLGSSKYGAGASIRGLKMGARYTYYYVVNGHIQMPDPTVAERAVDPRSGIICSVLNVPFQVAPGQKVIAGSPELSTCESFARELSACQSRQKQRPKPLNLNQGLDFPSYIAVDKPVASPTRANAPRRPTVVIPKSAKKYSHCTPISAVPSLTPSSGLNSAVSPTSIHTPCSGRGLRSKRSFGFSFSRSNSVREIGEPMESPAEGEKRRGFHIKTPSIPSISNLIGSGSSKARSGFPVISNPIPLDYERTYGPNISRSSSTASRRAPNTPAVGLGLGLGIDVTTSRRASRSSFIEDEEQILEAQEEAYTAIRDRNMSSRRPRPVSVASTTISDSPSLTQSEFSVESSPSPVDDDDASSISSSPMLSQYDSDVEIEADNEDEAMMTAMMASKLHISGKYHTRGSLEAVQADNLSDMENWYRNAVKMSKSRSSRYSKSTRFSDISCVTGIDNASQEGLYYAQTSQTKRPSPLGGEVKSRRLSPSLPMHAPMPVRPEAEAIVAIESMEAQAEARLRSFIRSSWGKFDQVDIASEAVSEEYQDYLSELGYLRNEVEDLRREREYLVRNLQYLEYGYCYE